MIIFTLIVLFSFLLGSMCSDIWLTWRPSFKDHIPHVRAVITVIYGSLFLLLHIFILHGAASTDFVQSISTNDTTYYVGAVNYPTRTPVVRPVYTKLFGEFTEPIILDNDQTTDMLWVDRATYQQLQANHWYELKVITQSIGPMVIQKHIDTN